MTFGLEQHQAHMFNYKYNVKNINVQPQYTIILYLNIKDLNLKNAPIIVVINVYVLFYLTIFYNVLLQCSMLNNIFQIILTIMIDIQFFFCDLKGF